MKRKTFIKNMGALGLGFALNPAFAARAFNIPIDIANDAMAPPLAMEDKGKFLPPNEYGVSVREGFKCELVAQSGKPVGNTGYVWHNAPDGGAIIPKLDSNGGYYYVSNCEERITKGAGGVSSIEFNAQGEVVNARRILSGTFMNCAGGVGPDGFWYSCEEHEQGRVWKTDPSGNTQAVPINSLGVFFHEAIAFDPDTGVAYMTEDRRDGLFYRALPGQGENGEWKLQAAVFDERYVVDGQTTNVPKGRAQWVDVPDPKAESGVPARFQSYTASSGGTDVQAVVPTAFKGGEGAIFDPKTKMLYFSTKFDNRIWEYDAGTQEIKVHWEGRHSNHPNQVDNLVFHPTIKKEGKRAVVIAEDNQNKPFNKISVFNGFKTFDLVRVYHQESELSGPAFAWVDGKPHLYFSSQRGPKEAGADSAQYQNGANGMTFVVSPA